MDEIEKLQRQQREAFAANDQATFAAIGSQIQTLQMAAQADQEGAQARQNYERTSTSLPVRIGATAAQEAFRIGGNTLDFGSDLINLNPFGTGENQLYDLRFNLDKSLPTAEETMQSERGGRMVRGGITGATFAVPGAAGFRGLTNQIGKFLPTKGKKFLRDLTEYKPMKEILTGFTAGTAGGYFESPYAQIAAEFTTPMVGQSLYTALSTFARNTVGRRVRDLQDVPEEIAAAILKDSLDRSDITVEEALKMYDELGPEGIPADISAAFRRALRNVTSHSLVEGRANTYLNRRMFGDIDDLDTFPGQGGRIRTATEGLDSYSGNAFDFIDDYKASNKAEIDRLYEIPKQVSEMPPGVQAILDEGGAMPSMLKKAKKRGRMRNPQGGEMTPFQIVDYTKRAFDGKIGAALRQGDNDLADALSQQRNRLVSVADETFPGYADARGKFAGDAAIETAVEQGIKLFQTPVHQVRKMMSYMSTSELDGMKIGAREAILNLVDTAPMSSEMGRRVVRTPQNQAYIRMLFGEDNAGFETFMKTLDREADFLATRRSIGGGSPTQRIAQDKLNSQMNARTAMLVASDPTGVAQYGFIANLIDKFVGKKNDDMWQDGLRIVGDVLLTARGTGEAAPAEFARLVSGGNVWQILDRVSQTEMFKKHLPAQFMRSLRGMTAVEMGEAIRARGEQRNKTNQAASIESSPMTYSSGI